MREISNSALDILKERYFLKDDKGNIIEDWEGLSKRVATFAVSCEEDKEYWYEQFYYIIKNRLFIPNSPTMMNAGTGCNTVSACFVIDIEDYMGNEDFGHSITDAWKIAALIGKEGGGIGYPLSKLRPRGDYIKTSGGKSTGPIPLVLGVLNEIAEAVKQGGRRRIAQMGVMRVDHPDIIEFINCKKTEGKINNFNISVGITDKFMDALLSNSEYDLINPKDGSVVKSISAKEIWEQIIHGAWFNGEPGVVFIDTINKYHNLKKLGQIYATNPCVTGDTLLLTKTGYHRIDTLINSTVEIWNGFEWSEVVPKITGTDQEIYDVGFSDGSWISCTPYHKFILKDGVRIEAHNLSIGLEIENFSYPTIDGNLNVSKDSKVYYTMGFYSGDGSHESNRKRDSIWLYGAKKALLNHLIYERVNECDGDRLFVKLPSNIEWDKEYVPSAIESIKNKLSYLSGLIDSDGTLNDDGGSIAISSSNHVFLRKVKLMIHSLGVRCSLKLSKKAGLKKMPDGKGGYNEYYSLDSYRILIPASHVTKLCKMGFQTNRVPVRKDCENGKDSAIKVVSISKRDELEKEVYCLNEPKNHSVMFNSVVTAQCGEQPLLPYESCVLGSIDVGKFVDFGNKFDDVLFRETVKVSVRFLDNMVTLQKAPIREIDKTTKANRKIGLGIMGFADALIKLEIPYGSVESFGFAEEIGKSLKLTAHEYSCHIAEQKGNSDSSEFYENSMVWLDIKGTPRNACQVSFAPTGTIASIADASFGIEPLYDICFIKNVMDKQIFFISDVVREYLEYKGYSDAVKEMQSGKTIDNINLPKEIKDVLITSYKLTPEQHVIMQSVFQKYCDSAISKTINFSNNATHQDVEKAYLMAYELGCKGITVYRDGSRDLQVVEIGKGKSPKSKLVERESTVAGITSKIETSSWKFYFTANRNKNGEPVEIFIEISDVSPDILSMIDSVSRMVSVNLKYSVPIKDIIKQLYRVENGIPFFYEKRTFHSFPHLIGYLLEKHFLNGEKVDIATTCDKCGVKLVFNSGCVTCPSCGYSKC